MQASNFGGTFDQLFLRIFLQNVHKRCLSTSSIPWWKKVKNDQKLKSRGGPALNVLREELCCCLKGRLFKRIIERGRKLEKDED